MNTKSFLSPNATYATPRPSIVQLVIKEKSELYAVYIPLFKDGGIFVATHRSYQLGDNIYVLLTLPEELQRYPVTGKVAWITPAQASGGQTQGIGIRFELDDKSRALKAKIEEIIVSYPGSNKQTLIM